MLWLVCRAIVGLCVFLCSCNVLPNCELQVPQRLSDSGDDPDFEVGQQQADEAANSSGMEDEEEEEEEADVLLEQATGTHAGKRRSRVKQPKTNARRVRARTTQAASVEADQDMVGISEPDAGCPVAKCADSTVASASADAVHEQNILLRQQNVLMAKMLARADRQLAVTEDLARSIKQVDF